MRANAAAIKHLQQNFPTVHLRLGVGVIFIDGAQHYEQHREHPGHPVRVLLGVAEPSAKMGYDIWRKGRVVEGAELHIDDIEAPLRGQGVRVRRHADVDDHRVLAASIVAALVCRRRDIVAVQGREGRSPDEQRVLSCEEPQVLRALCAYGVRGCVWLASLRMVAELLVRGPCGLLTLPALRAWWKNCLCRAGEWRLYESSKATVPAPR